MNPFPRSFISCQLWASDLQGLGELRCGKPCFQGELFMSTIQLTSFPIRDPGLFRIHRLKGAGWAIFKNPCYFCELSLLKNHTHTPAWHLHVCGSGLPSLGSRRHLDANSPGPHLGGHLELHHHLHCNIFYSFNYKSKMPFEKLRHHRNG